MFEWGDLWNGAGKFSVDDSSAWSLLGESNLDGIVLKIYLKDAVKGFEYLVRGRLPIHSDVFVALQVDFVFRKTWDTAAVEITELQYTPPQRGNSARSTVYYRVKYPFPVGAKDYTNEYELLCLPGDQKVRCLSAVGLPHADGIVARPAVKGVNRISSCHTRIAFAPADSGIDMAFLYYEDAPSRLPNWAIKLMASKTIPNTYAKMVKTAKTYPAANLPNCLSRWGIAPPREIAEPGPLMNNSDSLGSRGSIQEFFSVCGSDEDLHTRIADITAHQRELDLEMDYVETDYDAPKKCCPCADWIQRQWRVRTGATKDLAPFKKTWKPSMVEMPRRN